jgi:hypothetical protein
MRPSHPDLAFRSHRSRRQFLLGVGGAALALPWLPSLLDPRDAEAQSVPVRKRYVHFRMDHGAVWGGNLFPAPSTLTDRMMYADRVVQRGNLAVSTMGARAGFSSVLSAAPTVLTPALATRLNVIRGLDFTFEISHHTGGNLGNYAANTGQSPDAMAVQAYPRRSIDQVMAYSPTFYPNVAGVRLRSIDLGPGTSWNFANPAAGTGGLQSGVNWGYLYSSNGLFSDLFSGASAHASTRPLIIDRVIADYQRIRNGSRRLSTADRMRLDQHVQQLTDLQRRLGTTVSCGAPTRPTDSHTVGDGAFSHAPMEQTQYWDIYMQIIAMAFACGASCVATIKPADTFSTYTGDWHPDIAHNCDESMGQTVYDAAAQVFFEHVFLDLAQRLDAIDDGGGRTVLDNSLLVWSFEHGNRIHGSWSVPVITAGSAGGFVRTGSYIDYRNQSLMIDPPGGYVGDAAFPGLPWGQWLGTQLMAMGLPASEWAEPTGGYGPAFVGAQATAGHWYPASVMNNVSSALPYMRAGV